MSASQQVNMKAVVTTTPSSRESDTQELKDFAKSLTWKKPLRILPGSEWTEPICIRVRKEPPKLVELKRFAKMFEKRTPVPADMLPLLTKGKQAPEEHVKRPVKASQNPSTSEDASPPSSNLHVGCQAVPSRESDQHAKSKNKVTHSRSRIEPGTDLISSLSTTDSFTSPDSSHGQTAEAEESQQSSSTFETVISMRGGVTVEDGVSTNSFRETSPVSTPSSCRSNRSYAASAAESSRSSQSSDRQEGRLADAANSLAADAIDTSSDHVSRLIEGVRNDLSPGSHHLAQSLLVWGKNQKGLAEAFEKEYTQLHNRFEHLYMQKGLLEYAFSAERQRLAGEQANTSRCIKQNAGLKHELEQVIKVRDVAVNANEGIYARLQDARRRCEKHEEERQESARAQQELERKHQVSLELIDGLTQHGEASEKELLSRLQRQQQVASMHEAQATSLREAAWKSASSTGSSIRKIEELKRENEELKQALQASHANAQSIHGNKAVEAALRQEVVQQEAKNRDLIAGRNDLARANFQLESQLKSATEDGKKSPKVAALRRELVDLKAKLASSQTNERLLAAHNQECEGTSQTLREEKSDLKNGIRTLKTELTSRQEKTDTEISERTQQLTSDLRTSRKNEKLATCQVQELTSERDELTTACAELRERIDSSRERDQSQLRQEQVQEQLESVVSEHDSLRNEREGLLEADRELRSSLIECQQKQEQLQHENDKLKDGIAETALCLREEQQKSEHLQQDIGKLESSVTGMGHRLQEAQRLQFGTKKENDDLAQQVTDLKSELTKSVECSNTSQEQVKDLANQLEEKTEEINFLEDINRHIRDERDGLRNLHTELETALHETSRKSQELEANTAVSDQDLEARVSKVRNPSKRAALMRKARNFLRCPKQKARAETD